MKFRRAQILPPQYYQYYTWTDTFKPRELVISVNEESITTDLSVIFHLFFCFVSIRLFLFVFVKASCGVFQKNEKEKIYYGIFIDGLQTVLMFASEQNVIESASDVNLLLRFHKRKILYQ